MCQILCLSTAVLSHRQAEAGGATGVTHDNLRDQGHDKRDTVYNSRDTKALAAELHQIKSHQCLRTIPSSCK